MTSCVGSLTGRLRSTSACKMLKIAVFAPMPRASVARTINEYDGRLIRDRTANLNSCLIASIVSLRCGPLPSPVATGRRRSAYLIAIDHTCARKRRRA